MIPVQTIVDRCNFALDAEGSGRYLFEQDFKPAINSSIEWLVAVFNRVFAEKKLSEENLRELIKTRVFLASAFSRLNLDKDSLDGDSLWTILRVMPSPRVYPEFDESSIEGCDKKSKLMDELLYVGSSKSAKRLTLEEWEENEGNIFEAGNIIANESFRNYAYLNIGEYLTSKWTGGKEIEIRPDVSKKLVALTYLRYPGKVESIDDILPFPESMIDLIFQKALNFMSYKQGDQTTLYAVTTRDIQMLTQLMT
jgi:hypothetical protein